MIIRVLSLLFAALLVGFTFAGCGNMATTIQTTDYSQAE
jgi:hypothetical protein